MAVVENKASKEMESFGYKEEPQPQKATPKPKTEQKGKNLTSQKNNDNIKISKDMSKQSTKRLEKTIISDTERIEEHEYKIAHPEEFYDDWESSPEHIK